MKSWRQVVVVVALGLAAVCRAADLQAGSAMPTHGNLEQMSNGKYYTIRNYFSGGCLELCNGNVTDCAPPYMDPALMSQVWLNPVCTGSPGQLWRAVPTTTDQGKIASFLVAKQLNFCLNRCFGGGCGYRNNMVGYRECFLNSFDQTFALNGSQIQFARTDASMPGEDSCVSACFPGSEQAQCDYADKNLITPFNVQALQCQEYITQQWYVQ